jgi:hypothetical protein
MIEKITKKWGENKEVCCIEVRTMELAPLKAESGQLSLLH